MRLLQVAEMELSGLGSEAVTVTDSSVSASDLNTLNTNTDYNITVNATAISGSLESYLM